VPGIPVWIDGCHNPASAEVVAEQLDSVIGKDTPLHIIAGVLANKDAAGILAPFLPRAISVDTVPIPGHPHHAPDELAAWLQTEGIAAQSAADVGSALESLAKGARRPGAILILGSLYLAGEVLRANDERIT